MNNTVELTPTELLVGLQADLAMGASELNYLPISLAPLEESWHELAVR